MSGNTQKGLAQLSKVLGAQRDDLPKYVTGWVCEAVAYWLFVIIILDSTAGFSWWLLDRPHRFGWICIVYAIKNFIMLCLVPVSHHIMKKRLGGLAGLADSKLTRFPATDIILYLMETVFWIVSAIYAFDREITPVKVTNADWVNRYKQWTDNIYVLPVVKLCIDFVLALVSGFAFPVSDTAKAGFGKVLMDCQYLFVYLFITGKVTNWNNYFIVFVWIFMGSIIALMGAACILCGVFAIIFQMGKQGIALAFNLGLISVMIILFFAWECIIGDKGRAADRDMNYLLLVSIILYTLFNFIQTIVFIFKIPYLPEAQAVIEF